MKNIITAYVVLYLKSKKERTTLTEILKFQSSLSEKDKTKSCLQESGFFQAKKNTSTSIGILSTPYYIENNGVILNKYIRYLNQFSNTNIQLINPTFLPNVDVLIIPNMSSLDGRNMHDLPLIDPIFSSFLKHYFPYYKGTIVSFEYSALSLYYNMGGDIQACSGYNEEKIRPVVQHPVLPFENNHIFAHVSTNYCFSGDLDCHYLSKLVKQKKNTNINEVYSSFIKNRVSGVLSNPIMKENLVGSYDYNVAPYTTGDLLSNTMVFAAINNIKLI